jgi:hypothetical protein
MSVSLSTTISLKELVDWQLHWLCADIEHNILSKAISTDVFVERLALIAGFRSRIVTDLNTIYDYPPRLEDEIRALPKWKALEELIQYAKERRLEHELRSVESQLRAQLGLPNPNKP